jgi:hypothetical protein
MDLQQAIECCQRDRLQPPVWAGQSLLAAVSDYNAGLEAAVGDYRAAIEAEGKARSSAPPSALAAAWNDARGHESHGVYAERAARARLPAIGELIRADHSVASHRAASELQAVMQDVESGLIGLGFGPAISAELARGRGSAKVCEAKSACLVMEMSTDAFGHLAKRSATRLALIGGPIEGDAPLPVQARAKVTPPPAEVVIPPPPAQAAHRPRRKVQRAVVEIVTKENNDE